RMARVVQRPVDAIESRRGSRLRRPRGQHGVRDLVANAITHDLLVATHEHSLLDAPVLSRLLTADAGLRAGDEQVVVVRGEAGGHRAVLAAVEDLTDLTGQRRRLAPGGQPSRLIGDDALVIDLDTGRLAARPLQREGDLLSHIT